ncbi:aminotransferase [Pseudomonas mandelii JR-1]|uniref:Aminotransferase n=1 Tax=Pseudomonas mandelii JR-1 TaxID=1147786 RepID=A0A024EGS9_9PSED|nr:aminotransferase [Pseudomonas mandelii JR-1]
MWRSRAIRVAHAEVDDVFATTTGGHLQLGSDVEYVRGESIYARKAARRTWVSHCCLGNVSARNRPSDAGHCGGLWRNVRAVVAHCPATL